MKEGAQSLWYPYVHLKNEQNISNNNPEEDTLFTTKCHNGRFKNGELLLAVARQVMQDSCFTIDGMSSFFGVHKNSVKRALKKLREKLSAGQTIPGLSDIEMDNIKRIMGERAKQTHPRTEKDYKINEIIKEFEDGKGIPEIAKLFDISIKKLKEIMKNAGVDIGKHAVNLVWEGNSISEAAAHLGLKAKEVTEIIAGDKLFSEIICKKVVENGLSIDEIAMDSGLSKKGFMLKLNECGSGDALANLARFLSRIGKDVEKISQLLGTSKDKVKKFINWRIILKVKDIRVAPNKQIRPGISTMKPGKPKSRRESKRPATISRAGLAEWCMQHYDKNGKLQLPTGCSPPSDLPRKYPKVEVVMIIPDEPRSASIPAPPLSRAECTVRGRNRIRYLRLF